MEIYLVMDYGIGERYVPNSGKSIKISSGKCIPFGLNRSKFSDALFVAENYSSMNPENYVLLIKSENGEDGEVRLFQEGIEKMVGEFVESEKKENGI